MKLLIYSHFFAPSIGGVETIVLSLARGLAELRDASGADEFKVTVVTQTPAGNFDDSALPFCVIRQPGLLRLWRLIRSSDVVHAAGPALAPLLLARLARKPLVIEHHGYQAVCPNGLLLHHPTQSVCPGHFQAGRYLECWRCRSAELPSIHALISLLTMLLRHGLSQGAMANLAISRHVEQRQALPRSRIIYYGIPDPLKESSAAPQDAGTPQRPCFAYVGRLVQEKGIAVLLRAATILRKDGHEFQVRLIGDGPLRSQLEALIAQENLASCAQMTGYLTGPSLNDALRDVRVVVMPSIWEETAGLAAIEQMMRGRLVITSEIGGVAEIVGEAGLTFAAGDAQGLAHAMKMVLRDPSIVEALGQRARARAILFFLRERMIEDHAHAYRSLSVARDNDSSDTHTERIA